MSTNQSSVAEPYNTVSCVPEGDDAAMVGRCKLDSGLKAPGSKV